MWAHPEDIEWFERLDIKTGNGQILLGNELCHSNLSDSLGSQTTTSAAVGSEKSVFGQ